MTRRFIKIGRGTVTGVPRGLVIEVNAGLEKKYPPRDFHHASFAELEAAVRELLSESTDELVFRNESQSDDPIAFQRITVMPDNLP